MPGLLRGSARTAMIAGTATAVSHRVSRRQAGRWARQDQQEPDPPQLGELKSQGVLTEAEFAQQRAGSWAPEAPGHVRGGPGCREPRGAGARPVRGRAPDDRGGRARDALDPATAAAA